MKFLVCQSVRDATSEFLDLKPLFLAWWTVFTIYGSVFEYVGHSEMDFTVCWTLNVLCYVHNMVIKVRFIGKYLRTMPLQSQIVNVWTTN